MESPTKTNRSLLPPDTGEPTFSRMDRNQLFGLLRDVVRIVLDDDEVDFKPEDVIQDIPEWDSLNNMHIIVRIEKKLGLLFQQSDFEHVETISDLLDLIGERMGRA